MRAKWTAAALIIALAILPGCASTQIARQKHDLRQQIAAIDSAYRNLQPNNIQTYNASLSSLGREMERDSPAEFQQDLAAIGVKLDRTAIKLPVAHYQLVRQPRGLQPNSAGVPLLLQLDTSQASVYPPDGLLVAGTLIYKRSGQTAHLSPVIGQSSIELNGSTYPVKIDNVAPITEMARRGRHVARAGFRNMLHPATMPEGPRIFFTEPYDPNKRTLLIVPGLQSTPFAFVDLLKAMRLDPEVSKHFQVWTFLYATGTPVLFNALELREELEKTVRSVDPHDHDFATRHIVVLGHSMGGLIAHTLVSSSGEKLWNALFAVPPQGLKGDKAIIRRLVDGLHFHRNPRVVAAIFAATPHRGSQLAESWIGHLAASLIRLPSDLQSDIVNIVSSNPDAATPTAKAFHHVMNFSSVHTLSPRDPALQALAGLPVEVPFHSIIGQHNPGPIETSSDGVVSYVSAHLDGAASELVVRSGHSVCENPEAQAEARRILRLELQGRR